MKPGSKLQRHYPFFSLPSQKGRKKSNTMRKANLKNSSVETRGYLLENNVVLF